MTSNDQILPYGDPSPKDYETLSREQLKKHLSTFIADLLEHDFEKLCALLYRHDVSEEKFHHALQQGNVSDQAERVADLVIDRELEKVEMRKAYRKYKKDKQDKKLNQ